MAHILIVEDDTYIAKLLSFRLERSGHSIIWVSDGTHETMLMEPNVYALAERLGRYLG